MEVQVFGIRKSPDTRAALRFFAERRIKTHFMNFDERAPSPGELRRFAERFGLPALVEHEGHRFAAMGLKAALEKLSLEPLLLRMPLVRNQQQLTVGPAEETWKGWMK
jgi:arsenate reductase (glutaredoxin)